MKTKLQLPLFTFLLTILSFSLTTAGWGQIISQYTETNSGTIPKGIEVWNNTGATLDFSVNNLIIQQGTNGGALTDLAGTLVNSGSLASGEVMVIGTSDIGTYLVNEGLSGVTFVSFNFTFNGDDALSVKYGGVITDVFGTPGFDPGTAWTGGGVSTANQNIQLLTGITTGDLVGWSDPSLRFETVSIDPVNDLTGFGIAPLSAGTPLLSATPTTITGLDYIVGSGPSASQTFDTSGVNLSPAAGNVSVTAPANFEVSTDNTNFSASVNLPYTSGELTATPVYVRLQSGLAVNSYSDDVIISGGGATNETVEVNGEVEPIPVPTLLATPSTLTGLNYMEGNGPSAAQTFVLSGDALDGTNVNITVPAQFEISTDNVTYSGAIMLPAYDGSNTTIYVQLVAGLLENPYTGNADIIGGGATPIAVSLEGNVTPFIDPYTGTGVFELVTSLVDLEDGYYVVVNQNSEFAMSNLYTSPFLVPEAISLVNNTIVNPGTDIVWFIEANATGHTIYNDDENIYVSQTLNTNSVQVSSTITGDAQRWDFQYVIDKFVVSNLNQTTRILKYNSGAPRFASYTSGQQDLQLYKWIEVNDPVLIADPVDITGLNYTDGQGPSAAQTFEVSGLNLTGNDDVTVGLFNGVTSDFEISLDENTGYSHEIMLTNYDGSNTLVYVRLKAGLIPGSYNDVVELSGYGADVVEVTVSGNVAEIFELPYNNALRVQADWDQAIVDGFEFDGTSFQTTGSGYVRFDNIGNSITSPEIDFSDYDMIILKFSPATFGSINSPELSVQISTDNGLNYTTLETFMPTSTTHTFETVYVDVSAINSIEGRIRFEHTSGSQIRFRDLDMDFFEGYFFMNTTWFPTNPDGLTIPTQDVLVVNGDTSLTANTTINSLTVAEGASLNIAAALTANGNIANNGSLVFVSNASTTGQLNTFTGTLNGEVTVQRYIPGRRAFRLLSSSVSTSGSINANWQEGVNNTGVNFPVDNLNPNPGFGTHITGSMTGANGFDATPSGNPSLFTLDNATQLWVDVDNTDLNTIAAGKAYRLLVRGDRSIDVTSNGVTPTNTVLRTTGTLQTGTFATTDFNANAGAFNFFGNPYPASVDMNAVLSIATNINVNPNSYYIWDPRMGTRGAYATVDLPLGTSPGSDANQYLQPGQAAFVTTLANGPASLTFQESHKAVNEPFTQVFNVVSKIDLRMYSASAFAQSEHAADGLRIKFSDDYTNALTPLDAAKFYNLDENLATENAGNLLSIESRFLPQIGESIPLYTDQYRTTDYVFEAELNEVNDIVTLLVDHFTGTTTELLNNDTTLYAFQVDGNNPLSIADDRFEIVFEEMLSTGDVNFGNGFVLFPNPAQSEINIASRGIAGQQVNINITGILGQSVYNTTHTVETSGMLTIDTIGLSNGVYILKLSDANGGQYITKFIKK